MKDAEWDDVIATNLTGLYHLVQALFAGYDESAVRAYYQYRLGGRVMGNAGQANYAAAKAGIIGFSKSMAREVGSRGITVNVIAPGFIQTDMTKSLDDEQRTALVGQVPLNRLGEAQDVSSAAVVSRIARRRLYYRRNTACKRWNVYDLADLEALAPGI